MKRSDPCCSLPLSGSKASSHPDFDSTTGGDADALVHVDVNVDVGGDGDGEPTGVVEAVTTERFSSSVFTKIVGRAKGLIYLTALSSQAVVAFYALLPAVGTSWIPIPAVIRLRRRYIRFVSRHYFCFAAAVIDLLCGVKIFIHSDQTETEQLFHLSERYTLADNTSHYNNSSSGSCSDGMLIICNHHTRVDWMYAGWCYSAMLAHYPNLLFVLKKSLKNVPFFGWCMQVLMFIFLERRREDDLPKIRRMLSYLVEFEQPAPAVFLFPEGTDLSASNLEKSRKYAEDNKLPVLQRVLYPKPAGFALCVERLMLLSPREPQRQQEQQQQQQQQQQQPPQLEALSPICSGSPSMSVPRPVTPDPRVFVSPHESDLPAPSCTPCCPDQETDLNQATAAATTAAQVSAGDRSAAKRTRNVEGEVERKRGGGSEVDRYIDTSDSESASENNSKIKEAGAVVLHDLTIAYKYHTKGQRTDEAALLRGHFPREVHIAVRTYPKSSLPRDADALAEWLRDRFYEKEQLLALDPIAHAHRFAATATAAAAVTSDEQPGNKSQTPIASPSATRSHHGSRPLSSTSYRSRYSYSCWPPIVCSNTDLKVSGFWRRIYYLSALPSLGLSLLLCCWRFRALRLASLSLSATALSLFSLPPLLPLLLSSPTLFGREWGSDEWELSISRLTKRIFG